jgi:hypothetical protein
VRHSQMSRAGLHHLHSATKFMRSRRWAYVTRDTKSADLLGQSFRAYRSLVAKEGRLRTRSVAFEARISARRQHRRMCGWALCSRELYRSSNPVGGPARVFMAWVTAHQQEVSKVRGLTRLAFNQHMNACAFVWESWRELTVNHRGFRQAERAHRASRYARAGLGGLRVWSHWAGRRRRNRHVAREHQSRCDLRSLLPYFRDWRREVRNASAASIICANSGLNNLRPCWRAWRSTAATATHRQRCGDAFQSLRSAQTTREILDVWSRTAAKHSRVRKLVIRLERISQRWISESQWRSRVVKDPTLWTMFSRFSQAVDNPRSALSSSEPLASVQSQAFETLVSLIWQRQQLSVALGRLKGYSQPWLLGTWCNGDTPLLPLGSPYHRQTEIRLEAMIARLEAERSPEQAASFYALAYAGASCDSAVGNNIMTIAENKPGRRQVAHMQALSDLMVVYRPEWPSTRAVSSVLSKHRLITHRSASSTADRVRVPALNLSGCHWTAERIRCAPTSAAIADEREPRHGRRPVGRWGGAGAWVEDDLISPASEEPEQNQMIGRGCGYPSRPAMNFAPQAEIGYAGSSASPSFCAEASPHFGPRGTFGNADGVSRCLVGTRAITAM